MLGTKSISPAIRRSGCETLVTGIETFPPGSWTAPGGSAGSGVGGGVGPGAVLCTCAVGFEIALAVPSEFRAVTRTRRRCPRSAADRAYCEFVAPAMAVQPEPLDVPPSVPHRSHSYA